MHLALSTPLRPAGRLAAAGLAAALLGGAIALVVGSSAGWPWLAATIMAPDLALLLGAGRGLAPGQLHPRAVPLYNALHNPAGPLALGALAASGLTGASAGLGVAALAWGFHIAMDRAAGYGPRTRDGLQRS